MKVLLDEKIYISFYSWINIGFWIESFGLGFALNL